MLGRVYGLGQPRRGGQFVVPRERPDAERDGHDDDPGGVAEPAGGWRDGPGKVLLNLGLRILENPHSAARVARQGGAQFFDIPTRSSLHGASSPHVHSIPVNPPLASIPVNPSRAAARPCVPKLVSSFSHTPLLARSANALLTLC